MFVGEDDTALAGAEQLDAAVSEHGHEVDDVEVGDEGVGRSTNTTAEALLIGHHCLPSLNEARGAASA